jgi:phospholipid-binding lipoprotein MlaA
MVQVRGLDVLDLAPGDFSMLAGGDLADKTFPLVPDGAASPTAENDPAPLFLMDQPEVAASLLLSQAVEPGKPISGQDQGQTKDSAPPAPKPSQADEEPYDPFQKTDGAPAEMEEYDPWEPFNVAMFNFNRKLDEYVVQPVATFYDKVMPDQVQQGLSRVVHNIRFVPRFINNLAQGKVKGATIEVTRFVVNTSFGIGGLLDFAKEVFALETPDEDTGQTLGFYGVKPGPYLVIPFLGSFTLRDGLGFIGDLALDPFNWIVLPIIKLDGAPKLVPQPDTVAFVQLGYRAYYMVNERSLNLETTFEGVEKATVDLYGAVRNAYLQKRAKAIRE